MLFITLSRFSLILLHICSHFNTPSPSLQIHSIFEEVLSHFSSLTDLDLSYNPLQLLDHHTQLALTSLPRLRTLRLAGTGLNELPHGLLHTLITLRHLDLSDNKLPEVPPELQNRSAGLPIRGESTERYTAGKAVTYCIEAVRDSLSVRHP